MQSQKDKMSHNTYKLIHKSEKSIKMDNTGNVLLITLGIKLNMSQKVVKNTERFCPKDLKRLKMLWKIYPLVKSILFSHMDILKILNISQSLDIQNE